jgi:alcohol dehydrogenase class IV
LNNVIIPEFSLPSDIFIRQDITKAISNIMEPFGKRTAILLTAADFDMFYKTADQMSNILNKSGIGCMIYDKLPKEPNTEDIDEAVNFIKRANCSSIIGFGGIEAINCAKAVSILINNYIFCNDIFDEAYLRNPPVSLVTIPAFPVFGFEINPLFYVADITEKAKHVFFDKRLYPKAAIIDPSLAMMLPPADIVKNGLAALAVAIESVISEGNNNIVNTFALKAIDLIFRNLPLLLKEGADYEMVSFISAASIMSGIAFSTSYLSASMAIGLALSKKDGISLADAMGVLIPYIMEYNLTAATGKYVQMAKVMGENLNDITVIEAAIKAVAAVRSLESETGAPQKLGALDVQRQDLKEIAKMAMKYPFMENSPKQFDSGEIEAILISAL